LTEMFDVLVHLPSSKVRLLSRVHGHRRKQLSSCWDSWSWHSKSKKWL